MSRITRRAQLGVATAALGLLLRTSPALADDGPVEGGVVSESVVLDVTGPDATLVRKAVERELLLIVPPPAGTLTVRRTSPHEVTVAFTSSDGRRIERSIEVQSDAAAGAEEIALLAANLVRDDAGGLRRPKRIAPVSEAEAEPAGSVAGTVAPAASDSEGTEDTATPAPTTVEAPTPVVSAPTPSRPPTVAAAAPLSENGCARAGDMFPVAFDVIPFVGTSSSADARSGTRAIAANLLGGLGAGLRGFEIGGLFNIETEFGCGVQMANALNVVAGPFAGAQLAGAVNVSGDFRGAQLGGMVNVARAFHGAQVAGAVNVARGRFVGAQLSNGVNVTHGDVNGAQLSGFVNVASGDVSGVQGSLINVSGGRVRGVQIGFVNVAEESDVSLGIVNINTKGRTHLDLWSELEVGLLATAVKHGGKYWHSIYGTGTRLTDPGLTAILGFGGHFRFTDMIYLDVDVLGYVMPSFESWEKTVILSQARPVVGLNVIPQLALFAGPSFNALLPRKGTDWAPDYAARLEKGSGETPSVWPGVTLGMQGFAE